MFFHPAPSVKSFCAGLAERVALTRPLTSLLTMFVMGVIVVGGKRSLAAIGSATTLLSRYRGQVSRASRNRKFCTRDLFKSAFAEALRLVSPPTESKREKRRTWIAAIDDVSTTRGAFTKISNGIRKGRASRGHLGRKARPPSKSHTFILGLLITSEGVRLPLPRMTYRTKEYAKQIGKPFRKKSELLIQMLRDLKPLLPEDVDVVVVADAFFEGADIMAACRRHGWRFISPLDATRVFSDVTHGSNRERVVHRHARSLPDSAYEQIALDRGKELTVSFRRYTPDEKRRSERRDYRVAHEKRGVAGLGNVGVVYSWKSPVYRPRRDPTRETFKVLVCSDPELPSRLVVEYYELRWQVELFYRELKSGLGLGSYKGTSFEAYERLVDLTLLAFLFLELRRVRLLGKERSAPVRAQLLGARTARLRAIVKQEAAQNDVAWLRCALESRRARRDLLRSLENVSRRAA